MKWSAHRTTQQKTRDDGVVDEVFDGESSLTSFMSLASMSMPSFHWTVGAVEGIIRAETEFGVMDDQRQSLRSVQYFDVCT